MYVCMMYVPLFFCTNVSSIKQCCNIFLFYHSSICWGHNFSVFQAHIMKNLYSFMSFKKGMDNKYGKHLELSLV